MIRQFPVYQEHAQQGLLDGATSFTPVRVLVRCDQCAQPMLLMLSDKAPMPVSCWCLRGRR